MGGIRGEVPLEVCGKALSLAPTYRAIENIEVRLGVGMPELLRRAVAGDIRIRDLTIIVMEGLRGAGHTGKNGEGDAFPLEQVGEDVMAHFGAYAVTVGTFVGNALGGPVPKKEDAPSLSSPESSP